MNRQFLGEQIHGHLQLYKDLGVRYVVSDVSFGRDKSSSNETRFVEFAAFKSSSLHSPYNPQSAIHDQQSPLPPPTAADETLENIFADMGNCQRCKLAPTRTNLVFGSGNPHAELMFVGEAPGEEEDAQGLPFVGRAGRLLTLIIESIGFQREDVYICNTLKCRPPQNRNPETDEIAACEGFLFRQIDAVRPKVIIALGAPAAQTLLRSTEAIGKLRGRLTNYRGVKLVATYHPAYLLRSPLEKRKVWDDMRIVRNYLRTRSLQV